MNCPICKHGQMHPETATITLERAGVTIVFKGVPAMVCDNCGEQFVDESTTSRLLAQASEAVNTGVEVQIRTYAAA